VRRFDGSTVRRFDGSTVRRFDDLRNNQLGTGIKLWPYHNA
jgi:hypothetical protein